MAVILILKLVWGSDVQKTLKLHIDAFKITNSLLPKCFPPPILTQVP